MTHRSLLSRVSKIDWDFAGKLSQSPFSAIHFHPSRFASQVPAALIGLLSEPGDLVLDPFVGSGSTLVEAQRLHRRSLGIDLNPVAVLASRAKSIAKPATEILRLISSIKCEAKAQVNKQLSTLRPRIDYELPQSVQARKWYTPEVAENLGILWSTISGFEAEAKIIAEASFSAILLSVCRETRHWGYVCDNTTPKSERGADVLLEFVRTLDRVGMAYKERDAEFAAAARLDSTISDAVTLCGNAETILREMPARSIDLLVTSPPYFGVCDYIKAQRLSMEWFGNDIEPLRRQEIGARSKRHRGNASEEYIAELCAVFREVHRCLKPEAFAVIVIGESATRPGVLTLVKERFADLGLKCRLELSRTVSTQRRMTPSIVDEHLFVVSR